ncbi:hypothetical protein [Corynebacterium epidermidicanis]|uniref:hypothetical protein n=1 Tax=Corynebacterium epidermidicanis TaxID=1050174 RepID=UPI00130DA2ED|nr:hypothetical protein [Corynebacterium epidermidicanis]
MRDFRLEPGPCDSGPLACRRPLLVDVPRVLVDVPRVLVDVPRVLVDVPRVLVDV